MVALKPTQQLRRQPQKRGGRGCPELQAGRQQGVPAALLHTLPAPEEKEIFLKRLISLFFFFFACTARLQQWKESGRMWWALFPLGQERGLSYERLWLLRLPLKAAGEQGLFSLRNYFIQINWHQNEILLALLEKQGSDL